MDCAIWALEDMVISRSETASMCDFILYIFLMYPLRQGARAAQRVRAQPPRGLGARAWAG